MSDQNSPPEPEGNGPNPWVKSLMIWGGIFLALLMVVSFFGGSSSGNGTQLLYSDFRDKVAEGSVANVQISETQIVGEMKNGEQFSTIPVANDTSLPQLLETEAASGSGSSHKSVIMIYLTGGPPHQDMFDLKPEAPADIRGEFRPIATNLPGVQISEHMPRLAAMMDQVVPIRTLVGSDGRHSSFQCVTGHRFGNQPQGGWPGVGSVLSKLQGPVDPSVPPAVNLFMQMAHKPYNHPGSGFLGNAHSAFQPDGDVLANMKLNGVSLDRLGDRRRLRRGVFLDD